VLVQPNLIRFEPLGFCLLLTNYSTILQAVGRENLITQSSSSLSVKIRGHEAILLPFCSGGLHTARPRSTAHRLVGATRRKCGTRGGCLSIFRKIVV